MTVKQNSTLSSNKFDIFVSKITLNLIGFNLPTKKLDGKDKEENDDDNTDDYVFDFTIVYDRSVIQTFIICQYAGREDEMSADRNDSLLQAIYRFDPTLKHFRAYIRPNAVSSPHYADFLNQVSLNVHDPTCVKHSFDDDIFKKEIYNLLSRMETTSYLDEQ